MEKESCLISLVKGTKYRFHKYMIVSWLVKPVRERHIWHEFPNRDYHIWCFQMILVILEQLLYISDNLNSDYNNIKSHHILLFERKSGAL